MNPKNHASNERLAREMFELTSAIAFSKVDGTESASYTWSDFPVIAGDRPAEIGESLASRYFPQHWEDPVKQRDLYSDTSSTASVDSLSSLEESTHHAGSLIDLYSAASSSSDLEGPKRVTFSPILQIRTHETILGDHPICSGGMALECGWNHSGEELLDLDIFEEAHSSHKRRLGALHLSYGQRRDRLQECMGASGAQLLRLEYDQQCFDQQQQQRTLQAKMPTHASIKQKETASYAPGSPASLSASWRPLHHAGNAFNLQSLGRP